MVGALPGSDPPDESDLSDQSDACRHKKRMSKAIRKLTLTHSPLSPAVRTRLELATPCVTGRDSNQLNYRTSFKKLPGLLASAQRSEHRGFVSRLRVQSYSLFWNRANFSTTFFEVFLTFLSPAPSSFKFSACYTLNIFSTFFSSSRPPGALQRPIPFYSDYRRRPCACDNREILPAGHYTSARI